VQHITRTDPDSTLPESLYSASTSVSRWAARILQTILPAAQPTSS
jgi:hypothetical protein